MATLTVQTIDRDGVVPAYVAADVGGDEFANEGRLTFVYVKNTDASPRTVTFVTQKTVDGEAIDDKDVVVAATSEEPIGPFPSSIYDDASGNVQITYSAIVNLTIAVLQLSED